MGRNNADSSHWKLVFQIVNKLFLQSLRLITGKKPLNILNQNHIITGQGYFVMDTLFIHRAYEPLVQFILVHLIPPARNA